MQFVPCSFAQLFHRVQIPALLNHVMYLTDRLVGRGVVVGGRARDPLCANREFWRRENTHSTDEGIETDKVGNLRLVMHYRISIHPRRMDDKVRVKVLVPQLVLSDQRRLGLETLTGPRADARNEASDYRTEKSGQRRNVCHINGSSSSMRRLRVPAAAGHEGPATACDRNTCSSIIPEAALLDGASRHAPHTKKRPMSPGLPSGNSKTRADTEKPCGLNSRSQRR